MILVSAWRLVTAAALFNVVVASAAAADEEVTPGTNSFEAVSYEGDPGADAAAVAQASSAAVTYDYQPACVRGEGVSGQDFYGCGDRVGCNHGVGYFVWVNHSDGRREYLGVQCFEPNEVPAAATVTADAVLRAFRRIPVPASEVTIQPPGGKTLVNLDTVFSTEAEGFTRTIGLLGHRVDLDITPSEFRWVAGDGTVRVTDWAGRPWREGASLADLITHRYEDVVNGLRPRVDTTWSARYRVDGGPWRDVPGTVTITGASYDLAVLSASPALTGAG